MKELAQLTNMKKQDISQPNHQSRKWGMVFNSITKQPVELAIVRLMADSTGHILSSAVTDKTGRYFFMVNDGTYRISVSKGSFVFPTIYLKGETADIHHADLYQGEKITISGDGLITKNIPIDPVSQENIPNRLLWEGIARRLLRIIIISSLVAIAGMAIATPTPIMLGLFAANVVIYVLVHILLNGRKAKSWGVVLDKQTKKPLHNAIVRIFEADYNKLVKSSVTDIHGRYAFLVNSNSYYLTFERPGYQKKMIGPIVLSPIKSKERQLVAFDVALDCQVDLINPTDTSHQQQPLISNSHQDTPT
ncbi:MAG: carboxypeptidase-like regulatory domain-containing protein [Patescibacteria group bacterium]